MAIRANTVTQFTLLDLREMPRFSSEIALPDAEEKRGR